MYSDPLVAAFNEQRHTAKTRGLDWRLAYWEWLQIWQDSGHLQDRGTHKGQWCMSRPGDRGAYESGNVRIVRIETNSDEGNRGRKFRPRVRLP
jgi:hypothetical protein